MPTPIPDGYTPHGTHRTKVHLRPPGPDRYRPALCGASPPAYRRGAILNLEEITCQTCRILGRHAAATTQTRHTPPSA